MIYWYSGTGTSLRVARLLASLTHDGLACMVPSAPTDNCQSCPALNGSQGSIGLVLPVYGWRPPRAVEEFIERLPAYSPAEHDYVYAVLTCGDDIGRTDRVLRKLLQRKGWPLHAVHSVQQRNTYVCLPGFDVDAAEVEASKQSEGDRLIEQRIVPSILCHLPSTPDCVTPGSMPGLKTYVLGWLFRHLLTAPHRFKATERCTGCGSCLRNCPQHNISADPNGHPHWGDHCSHCLACYHVCPHHAITYGPFTRGKGQVKLIRQPEPPQRAKGYVHP